MDATEIRMMQLAGKGYTCSQIMMQLALELRGEENPGLVCAMAGLAYGCGAGDGTCGVLTGGCCILGLYAGKGSDGQQASERLMLMLTELSEWFSHQVGTRYGGIECQAIVGDEGPAASARRCGEMIAMTYAKVLDILADKSFDV